MLEELANLEMELPARSRTSVLIELIETIPHIDANRSQRTDDSGTKSEGMYSNRAIG
jgi:hypothetical protein